MSPTPRILVVDDEANMRSSLERILVRDGYQVVTVASGQAALELIPDETFDLALIDLKMKGVGGMEVLAALRQRSPDTIVIIFTAHATLETAVKALRHGAHDYLFKPFNPVELRESVRKGLRKKQSEIEKRSLLRQLDQMSRSLDGIRATLSGPDEESQSIPAKLSGEQDRFLQRGGLIVDYMRHVVTLDGCLLELSLTEFNLLACLIREAPQVISARELVREVQGYESEQWEASETVRQHIYRIRQKIKEATGRSDVIRTVRGVGYTLGD
jgi:DNA-binding response OmpR family regulator